ncbi:BON domain-containing protein (plasmid) [Burkholderia multivorans]|uniref:BON domain-containing protein n=1 Tax=Burkholderia multivorans TaxID=87883 RepID=UPI00207CCC6B|nr:BON domain-containing protein [Burkholderia multivorans]MCO1422814.1 BON domain-containing protein [Burkholderia multivorans]
MHVVQINRSYDALEKAHERMLSSHTSIRTALIAVGLVAGLGIGAACLAAGENSMSKTASSVGTAIDDTAITTKVKARLMGEEGLGKSDISVTTVDGVVTLDGTVSSLHAKSVAESAAGRSTGFSVSVTTSRCRWMPASRPNLAPSRRRSARVR